MGMFKKKREAVDKNKGLNEEQRKQMAELDKKRLESITRLQAGLEGFRREYKELVLKYGIKFIPRVKWTVEGAFPYMVEQECREEIEMFQKRQEESVVKQDDAVIRN